MHRHRAFFRDITPAHPLRARAKSSAVGIPSPAQANDAPSGRTKRSSRSRLPGSARRCLRWETGRCSFRSFRQDRCPSRSSCWSRSRRAWCCRTPFFPRSQAATSRLACANSTDIRDARPRRTARGSRGHSMPTPTRGRPRDNAPGRRSRRDAMPASANGDARRRRPAAPRTRAECSRSRTVRPARHARRRLTAVQGRLRRARRRASAHSVPRNSNRLPSTPSVGTADDRPASGCAKLDADDRRPRRRLAPVPREPLSPAGPAA